MRFRKRQHPPAGPDATARSDAAGQPEAAGEPGAPPSIVLATLLNATGFGAGYVYLRRFVRWGFYLLASLPS
jgi:hypothetical protein